MAQVISIVNQKGGVGKTTSSINLASYLSQLGKFVLLLDLDPQANATSGVGIDHRNIKGGVYDAICGSASFKDIVVKNPYGTFDVAPATPELAGANIELVSMPDREYFLKNAILDIRNDYDYVIIDCPPSLGILTVNGLAATDYILIPVQAEYYALEGLGHLLETIKLVKEHLKPDIEILGAMITMFDSRVGLSGAVMDELYQYFPNRIFRSVIPRSVRLAEAPSHGKSILEYDPKGKGAKAYSRLAREIVDLENNN
ncbi:MAG: ParA family protein [Patescibacteria group bacterium]|nr:ParA family protein [Patescibacteria group bacterium]